ncbi:MAG: TlpA family protein disulfide reductase [Roseiflexaceae bacterium]
MQPVTRHLHPMSLLILVVGLCWIVVTRQPAVLPVIATSQQRIPTIRAQTLSGSIVQTTPHPAHPVIYVLWASWCPPCRAELPVLQGLAPALADTDIAVVLVNQGESPDTAAQWLAQMQITLPAWYDPVGAFATAFQAHDLPSTIFVDAHGVVDLVYRGPVTREVIETMRDTWLHKQGDSR